MSSIEVTLEDDGGLLRVDGDLDIGTVPTFARALRDAAPYVRIDLAGCTFFDSTGVAALVAAKTRSNPGLSIVDMSGRVRRVLTLCGLHATFTGDPTPPGA